MSYSSPPTQELEADFLEAAGVRLLVRREDRNHPQVSGNKWWKLKHNLLRAQALGHDTLLTVGGAYSNHIYAVAAAAHALGWKSIGIIRGEETWPLNPTLQFAIDHGMTLEYVSRSDYREKATADFLSRMQSQFGKFYFLPEGGTNELAVQGCHEWGERLIQETEFDILCLPVGTGGTMAGILQALREDQQAIGFSVLKNGTFLREEVEGKLISVVKASWRIETRFDFGGYAKATEALWKFMDAQERLNRLPLDPMYTGKTLYGVFELIRSGEIPRATTVLMIHTGGLQGRGINQRDLAAPR
ncbi:MAG: pyridoxal-phosphate dependent enzyme [Cyclobacteriaceae bacterium]|nr:pyridoxal-phosphate dependent enzyme [Cyclobacteriaceae bacterium]